MVEVMKSGGILASKCMLVLLVATGLSARAAEYHVTAGGDWEVPANWTGATGATGIPGGSDQIVINGSVSGKVVTMDADSWQYLVNNSLLTGGASGEYRTYKLLLAGSNTATLSLDIGDGHVWKTTEGGTYYIGSASGSVGTLNVLSGEIILETSSMRIGENTGSSGLVNISGSAGTRLIFGRESGGESAKIGIGGEGILQISGGTFQTRAGITLGGGGTFHVEGSDVAEIGIGSYSGLDGNWIQNTGGTLKVDIDAGGLTPIFVDDIENDGTGGDVTFASGALLDIGFLDGTEREGSWDVMHWEGSLTDNGLTFAPGVDTAFWSFSWVDTDAVNGADTLRVSFLSHFTSNGTPYAWLQDYYPGLVTDEEYQLADDSDSDQDALFTWEEYITETDPTNGASVLAMNAPEIMGESIVLSWSSVAGKRYGLAACEDLITPVWNPIASGIIGHFLETSFTSTVSIATNLFYQAYVESMPNLLELDAQSDAYVRDGVYANTNYGSSPELKTLNSDDDQMELLLRFDLPSTTENPDSAFIWVHTTTGQTDPVENAAFLVDDNSWGENSVTWNNQPAGGSEIDAWVTTNNRAIKIDVTKEVSEALNDGGLFSIKIKSPHNIGSDGQSVYASRENTETPVPKLVLNFNEPKVEVQPGQSIQAALNSIHAQGGGHVILATGAHVITDSLVMFSDITLRGQGAGLTSILLDTSANEAILIGTSEGSVNSDITIRDLTLNGQQDSNEQHYPIETDRNTVRGDSFGILFTDQDSGNTFERIRLENVTITRCAMGVHMKGVDDLRILDSEIYNNGCIIGYDHNMYYRRAKNTLLKNLNISDCKAGNGFNLSTACFNLIIDNCDASDNNFRGIRFEANDGGARMMIINCITSRNGLTEGQPGIRVANVPDFTIIGTTANDNADNGIYCVGSSNGLIKGNTALGNGDNNYYLQNCSNIEASDNVGW